MKFTFFKHLLTFRFVHFRMLVVILFLSVVCKTYCEICLTKRVGRGGIGNISTVSHQNIFLQVRYMESC